MTIEGEKIRARELTLEGAIWIATLAYSGQKDKSGKDAVLHPLAVMSILEGENDKIAGVLHDVVEDKKIPLEELEEMGCPRIVIAALKLLTHAEGFKKTEVEYINEIQAIIHSGNQIAIDVKWADLTHNSSPDRNPHPNEEDLRRLEKYKISKEMLKPYISDYLRPENNTV